MSNLAIAFFPFRIFCVTCFCCCCCLNCLLARLGRNAAGVLAAAAAATHNKCKQAKFVLSFVRLCAYSLIHSLIHSLARPLARSLIRSFVCSWPKSKRSAASRSQAKRCQWLRQTAKRPCQLLLPQTDKHGHGHTHTHTHTHWYTVTHTHPRKLSNISDVSPGSAALFAYAWRMLNRWVSFGLPNPEKEAVWTERERAGREKGAKYLSSWRFKSAIGSTLFEAGSEERTSLLLNAAPNKSIVNLLCTCTQIHTHTRAHSHTLAHESAHRKLANN